MSHGLVKQNCMPALALQRSYDPALFLDTLCIRMTLKDDAELAKMLKINKRLIGKIRDGRMQISGSLLMLMQEATGIGISELRLMLKDRRRKIRMAGTLCPESSMR